jgi:hypothetical protein
MLVLSPPQGVLGYPSVPPEGVVLPAFRVWDAISSDEWRKPLTSHQCRNRYAWRGWRKGSSIQGGCTHRPMTDSSRAESAGHAHPG